MSSLYLSSTPSLSLSHSPPLPDNLPASLPPLSLIISLPISPCLSLPPLSLIISLPISPCLSLPPLSLIIYLPLSLPRLSLPASLPPLSLIISLPLSPCPPSEVWRVRERREIFPPPEFPGGSTVRSFHVQSEVSEGEMWKGLRGAYGGGLIYIISWEHFTKRFH